MNFISEHITCELPSKDTDLELYNLVNKYQRHTCGNYCLRSRKSKQGKFCKACRFSFPRTVTSKLILFDPVESILGRLSSDYKKRFYHCKRNQEEVRINDYNRILISQWNANMDIQFISESTYSLVGYVTKYVTKGDKSHLSNDDFGLEESIIRRLWSIAYGGLKGREIGAYEASDRWFLDSLYASSAVYKFVSTVFSNNRTKMLKNLKDLEETDPNSSDIFNKDLLSTFYPERPNHMENMSLRDYAASYERAYPIKKGNATTSNTNSNIIKLNGDNGIMKKRLKKALIYHHEFDPNVYPEKYYYSLLLLFKPWRKDSDLLEKCTTYKEEFDHIVNDYPDLREYDQRKQKIMNSKKKVDDEVSKKLEKIEEEGVDVEPEVGIDDGSALDQVLYDFDAINNVDSISTEAELDAIVETLNIDQRRIYDKIISAIIHSLAHAVKSCKCDSFQPLLLYVSGFGGTGKSYLIKIIMAWAYIKTNVLKTKCKILLVAPTGISAAGISGMTLHSALSLPIEHNGKMTYKPLTGAKLQQIQACMRYVYCVMIDEISMVSNMTLLHVHLRLNEIFGCRNGSLFGSQVVIVFGDLLQLPPVKGEEVFLSLSEKQIKAAIGMMSKNLSLWSHFSYDELKINQRQKNDDNSQFKECLSRLRVGFHLSDDRKLLSNRLIKVSKVNPMESLVHYYNNLAKDGDFPVCLLPTRTMVCEFNDAVLASRSINTVKIPAIDQINCINKMQDNAQKKLAKMNMDDRNTAGLEGCLKVAVGTRVMLRRNIDTGKKLVNGSVGTITNLKSNQNGHVRQIVINFDGISEPVELNRDKRKIRIFENAYVYREQFPLACAYAITIHKSQGLSLKCVMADLGDSIFSEGQIYVALSRVQTLSGLHLININFNRIKASSKALAFYASKSSEEFARKTCKLRIAHSENMWYTSSKRKKQAEMIKDVIKKVIKDSSSKHDCLNKNDIDNMKTSSFSGTKQTKRKIETEANSSKLKKQKIDDSHHNSLNAAPQSNDTWHYDPVDFNWQQDRANKLGLNIHTSTNVNFKEPRHVSVTARWNRTYRTMPDGNCFFRAITMYLTGNEDDHIQFRAMVVNHVQNNFESYLNVSEKTDDEFSEYLTNMKKTRHWADTDIIIATSSFLKTPIVCYSPQNINNIRTNVWYTVDGFDMVGETNYNNECDSFNHTLKQIILNNESGDHFEPAEF